jgi:hypothetical protein
VVASHAINGERDHLAYAFSFSRLAASSDSSPRLWLNLFSSIRFVFEHLAATVKAIRADVVTQMRFASGWLYSNTWHVKRIVRTVHTAL